MIVEKDGELDRLLRSPCPKCGPVSCVRLASSGVDCDICGHVVAMFPEAPMDVGEPERRFPRFTVPR